MGGKTIKNIGVFANPQKEHVLDYVKKIVEYALSVGWECYISDEQIACKAGYNKKYLPEPELAEHVDMALSLGGDGTILRSARYMGWAGKPILGINFGGLGFLTETAPANLDNILERLSNGDFWIQERMTVMCTNSRTKKVYVALNDIVVTCDSISRLIELEVTINGERLTTYTADGLIVSTPTGSTAHSLSAGGPILSPDTEVILLTPICPHTLTNRPLIVNKNSDMKILLNSQGRDAMVTIDGQCSFILKKGENICVSTGPHKIKLVTFHTHSKFEIMRMKLNWGGRR